MNILFILLVSLALGIHVFEVTMKTGATQGNMGWKRIAGMGLLFGVIQIVMMILGIVLTYCVIQIWKIPMIWNVYHIVVFAIMFWFAIYEFWMVKRENAFQERLADRMPIKVWSLIAARSGLESVILGMGIYFFDPTSPFGVICVLCFGLIAPILGLWYGYFQGFQGRRLMGVINGIAMGVLAFVIILI